MYIYVCIYVYICVERIEHTHTHIYIYVYKHMRRGHIQHHVFLACYEASAPHNMSLEHVRTKLNSKSFSNRAMCAKPYAV